MVIDQARDNGEHPSRAAEEARLRVLQGHLWRRSKTKSLLGRVWGASADLVVQLSQILYARYTPPPTFSPRRKVADANGQI